MHLLNRDVEQSDCNASVSGDCYVSNSSLSVEIRDAFRQRPAESKPGRTTRDRRRFPVRHIPASWISLCSVLYFVLVTEDLYHRQNVEPDSQAAELLAAAAQAGGPRVLGAAVQVEDVCLSAAEFKFEAIALAVLGGYLLFYLIGKAFNMGRARSA